MRGRISANLFSAGLAFTGLEIGIGEYCQFAPDIKLAGIGHEGGKALPDAMTPRPDKGAGLILTG